MKDGDNYMKNKIALDMLNFIEKSPSSFHAVANLASMFEEAGYEALDEKEDWKLSTEQFEEYGKE